MSDERLTIWRCSECGVQLPRPEEYHWHPELGEGGEYRSAEEVEVVPAEVLRGVEAERDQAFSSLDIVAKQRNEEAKQRERAERERDLMEEDLTTAKLAALGEMDR